jgi:hypothetical protein
MGMKGVEFKFGFTRQVHPGPKRVIGDKKEDLSCNVTQLAVDYGPHSSDGLLIHGWNGV